MKKRWNGNHGKTIGNLQNQNMADTAVKKTKQRKIYRRISAVLGTFLAAFMFYSLMKPAITLEKNAGQTQPELICMLEEHTHTEECWGYDHPESEAVYGVSREMACSFVPHVHDESCYDENGLLICGLSEVYYHVHDEFCYDHGNLVCKLEEHAAEPETEEVRILVCGQEEHAGHVHSQDCYTTMYFTDEDPICGLEEGGPHEHREECLGLVLNCDKDHEHTDECFTVGLVCGLEAGQGHVHTLECYPSIRRLLCGSDGGKGTSRAYRSVLAG